MDKLAFQIGAASLGIGAFSGTIDLLSSLRQAYGLWKDVKELDSDLSLLRTKLLLQQDLLEQWQRDWYGFAVTGKGSIYRQRLLKQHDDVVRATLKSIDGELEKLKPLREYAKSQAKPTVKEKAVWVSGRTSDHRQVLGEIESLLAGLYRLLPPRNPNVEAIEMIGVLDWKTAEKAELASGDTNNSEASNKIDSAAAIQLIDNQSSPLTLQAFRLKTLGGNLASDLATRVTEFREKLPEPRQVIQAGRVNITGQDAITVGGRSFGLMDDSKPVIVEWKRYDATWRGQKAIRLRGRIDNLARMLGTDIKPEELLTLKCLGYFDKPSESRYGFVSEFPDPSNKVTALKTLLDAPSADTLPALEDRYRMAYALSLSLSILHAAEWLHKSIRSHNVLFPSSNSGVSWSRPYLVGFEYSREDAKDAPSEKPEDSARFNLYRHPSCQGTPSERFRREFDIYSFGVLLVEIGTWRSAWKLWDERTPATKFREDLITLTKEKVAHFMGVEYRDAALKCLTGELAGRSESILKAFFVEVVEVLGRLVDE